MDPRLVEWFPLALSDPPMRGPSPVLAPPSARLSPTPSTSSGAPPSPVSEPRTPVRDSPVREIAAPASPATAPPASATEILASRINVIEHNMAAMPAQVQEMLDNVLVALRTPQSTPAPAPPPQAPAPQEPPTARRSRPSNSGDQAPPLPRSLSSSPPPKISRHSSVSSSRSTTPAPSPRARLVSFSSTSSDDVEEVGEVEDDSWPEASTSAPSASGGWQPIPSDWSVRREDGDLVPYAPSSSGDPEAVPRVEIYVHNHEDGTAFYFRPRAQSDASGRSIGQRIKDTPRALASLTIKTLGSKTPGPDILVLGHGRAVTGCGIKGVSLSPALALDSLPTVWASKAAGDKASDRDDTRNDPKPLKHTWPEGSAEDRAAQFLQDSSLPHGILPGGLSKPSAASLKKDGQARAYANRLLQVSSNIDLLTYECDAALATERDWSTQDTKSFIQSTKEVLEGISSLLAPATRDAARLAVAHRVALREEAIPKSLASLKPKLLGLDPLSPFLFGPPEAVSTIINSRPPPATVEIKGLTQLAGGAFKLAPHSKGNGRGKSNSGHHSGSTNRSGGGRGKGSSNSRPHHQSKQPRHSKKPFHKPGGGGNKSSHKSSSPNSSQDSKGPKKQ